MFGHRRNECEEKFNKLAVKLGMSSWEDIYDMIAKENEKKESNILKSELSCDDSYEESKAENIIHDEGKADGSSDIIAMLDEMDSTIEKCLKEVEEINALNS